MTFEVSAARQPDGVPDLLVEECRGEQGAEVPAQIETGPCPCCGGSMEVNAVTDGYERWDGYYCKACDRLYLN